MPTNLYDLTVANYLQTVTAVEGYLEKSLAHFKENKVDLKGIVETRLFADMLPFRFQIQAVRFHSMGLIEALDKGKFFPPTGLQPLDYAGLQQLMADTHAALHKIKPDEINKHAGRNITFVFGKVDIPFVVENFVMSFSLPNFHFHATTAYDILRMQGVPLGKRDYLGNLRIKV